MRKYNKRELEELEDAWLEKEEKTNRKRPQKIKNDELHQSVSRRRSKKKHAKREKSV